MILERTLTNGDTIKTALLDAERQKRPVTFYTRTRTMIDKFTCRDTENKPITLGRFTISGGLIYYKRGEYSWQNISLDDVLKIDISDPETAPEETPTTPTIPAPPYNTPEEITAAFIADGWKKPHFREATPDERTRLGANIKLFIMTDTGNIYNDRGEIYCYNLPAATTSPATDESQESTTDAPTTPESAPETSPALYKYGMRSRGYSIAAQPAGVVAREDDPTGIYYDVICYERELTPAELDHYSLDPLQPAREPAQAASQDATSPAIISDKETTTASPENGTQAAREETPERLKESPRDNPGTTTPPGIYKAIPGPETVTESTNSQPGTPAAAHDARPRRGPTRPARTASHTDTHGGHKTPYKAKYKARRTHAAPPGNTYFFKNPRFVGLVSENVTETICDTKGGPVFEQVLGQLYTEGPPGG